MLMVISPAKKMDFGGSPYIGEGTESPFLDEAQTLIERMRQFDVMGLSALMKLSENLSKLNCDRYQQWTRSHSPENARPALLAFKGDVYEGMQAGDFSVTDMAFANTHLAMLSGLYGLLQPLDMMQPYRLEMGTRLMIDGHKNLYGFWGDKITDALNAALKAQGDDVLINLASNEYFKAVRPSLLEGRVLTLAFKEKKGDVYKTIGIHAKRARGLMAHHIIVNAITRCEDIKSFDVAGYQFNAALSSDQEWVFAR